MSGAGWCGQCSWYEDCPCKRDDADTAEVGRAELVAWIDAAGYGELLERWRFAPVGDAIFSDSELSARFRESMAEKHPGAAGHAAASKRIGWEPR